MPGLSSLALTLQQTIEILSLYATSNEPILAVAADPGWNVIGGFPMPTTADILLDLFGSVSDPSLTMIGRLYCVTPGFVGEVSGSRVQLTSTIDTEEFSSQFTLPGNMLYQVQVEVIGNSGDSYFGYARRIAPAGI
jgi:hypothetical protein